MACLDTTFLIDLYADPVRGAQAAARTMLEELARQGEPLCTTRFNIAELYVGAERSPDPDAERNVVRAITDRLTVLDFDDAAAQVFGGLSAHLARIGRPAGDMDVLIASVAMVYGEPLISRNVRHFQDMPGLVVRTY